MKILISILFVFLIAGTLRYKHQMKNFNDMYTTYTAIRKDYVRVVNKKNEIEGELAGLKIVNNVLNERIKELERKIKAIKERFRIKF